MVQRFAFHGRRPPIGSRPGDLALPAEPSPREIHVIEYGPGGHLVERDVTDVEELAAVRSAPGVKWIEVNGFGDEAGLRRIGEIFGMHPLALADVVNVPQRPKVESYEGHDLVIAWMARLDAEGECELVQVSFIVGGDFVISFEEQEERRLRPGAHAHPRRRADLLDVGRLPRVRADRHADRRLLPGARGARRGAGGRRGRDHRPSDPAYHGADPRRAAADPPPRAHLRQHRDALSTLARGENGRIGPEVRIYLRDAYDHAVQIIEVLETYREIAVSLMEMYLSSAQQPHERGDEGADHHLDDLHSADVHRRRLRHELRAHAGAASRAGPTRRCGSS